MALEILNARIPHPLVGPMAQRFAWGQQAFLPTGLDAPTTNTLFVFPNYPPSSVVGPAVMRQQPNRPPITWVNLAPETNTEPVLRSRIPHPMVGPIAQRWAWSFQPWLPFPQDAPVTNTEYVGPTYPASRTTGPMALRTLRRIPWLPFPQDAPASNTEFIPPTYPPRAGPVAVRQVRRPPPFYLDDRAPVTDTEPGLRGRVPNPWVGPLVLRTTWRTPWLPPPQDAPTSSDVAPPSRTGLPNPRVGSVALRRFWRVLPTVVLTPETNDFFVFPSYPRLGRRGAGPVVLRTSWRRGFAATVPATRRSRRLMDRLLLRRP